MKRKQIWIALVPIFCTFVQIILCNDDDNSNEWVYMEIFNLNQTDFIQNITLKTTNYPKSENKDRTGNICVSNIAAELVDCIKSVKEEAKTPDIILITNGSIDDTNQMKKGVRDQNISFNTVSYLFYGKHNFLNKDYTRKGDNEFLFGIDSADIENIATKYANQQNITGKVIYTFEYNCGLIGSIYPGYIVIIILWGGLITLWLLCILHWFKNETKYLHKAMTVIPCLKILQDSMQMGILLTCPWSSKWVYEYLDMMRTSISTVYDTLLIALIILLSTGFSMTHESISKNELTFLVMMMGIAYLLDSTYYISQGIGVMQTIIRFFMAAMYGFILGYVHYHVQTVIKYLKMGRSMLADGDLHNIRRALLTKIYMFYCYLGLIYTFSIWAIFLLIVDPFLPLTYRQNHYMFMADTVFSFLFVLSLFILFNPYWYSSAFNLGSLQGLLSARRDWPKWYSLDVSLNRVRTGYNPSSLLIEKDPYIIINPMDWDEEGRTNIEDQKKGLLVNLAVGTMKDEEPVQRNNQNAV